MNGHAQTWFKPGAQLEFPVGGSQAMVNALVRFAQSLKPLCAAACAPASGFRQITQQQQQQHASILSRLWSQTVPGRRGSPSQDSIPRHGVAAGA